MYHNQNPQHQLLQKIVSNGLNFIDGTNTIDNDGNESTDWTGNKIIKQLEHHFYNHN